MVMLLVFVVAMMITYWQYQYDDVMMHCNVLMMIDDE